MMIWNRMRRTLCSKTWFNFYNYQFYNCFHWVVLLCAPFDGVDAGDEQRNHQEVPQKNLLEEREKWESEVHSSCQDVLDRHWHHMAALPARAQQAWRTCSNRIPVLGLGLAGGQNVNKWTTLCREFEWKKIVDKFGFSQLGVQRCRCSFLGSRACIL